MPNPILKQAVANIPSVATNPAKTTVSLLCLPR
jgi:hypothetical protein